MPTKYTSFKSFQQEAEFRCGGCGFQSPVEVIGVTHGASNTTLLQGHEGAQAAAAATARAAVPSAVRQKLGLCPCPKCGRRNMGTAVPFWIMHLGIAPAIFVVLAFFILAETEHLGLTALVVIAVITSLCEATWFWAVGPLDTWRNAKLFVKFPL